MVILCPSKGVFHPLPGNPVHPKARLAFVLQFVFFFLSHSTSAATRSSRTLHGNSRPRASDLARDVMQLHVYLVPHGRHHPAGIYSLLPDSDYTCSHDVTLCIQKQTSQSEGFHTRAHVLCPSELHKHARVENPSDCEVSF